MTQPKAQWERLNDAGDYQALIGPYQLGILTMPEYTAWSVAAVYDLTDASDYDMVTLARGEVTGPYDVVTLMLAAESALEAHLRGVAETMRWPVDNTIAEGDGEPHENDPAGEYPDVDVAELAAAERDEYTHYIQGRSPRAEHNTPAPEWHGLSHRFALWYGCVLHVRPPFGTWSVWRGEQRLVHERAGSNETAQEAAEAWVRVNIQPEPAIEWRHERGALADTAAWRDIELRAYPNGIWSVWCSRTGARHAKDQAPDLASAQRAAEQWAREYVKNGGAK